ncbi:MAG: hydroxyacylglutathione hydrolase [Paracoccaceae bacterium]
MPLKIVTVACLADNYVFLLHSDSTGETALIDAPEAKPVLDELSARGWHLTEIWLTHHHWDHIDAVSELKEITGAKVIGAAADAHRLPPLNEALSEGSVYEFAGHKVQVLDVSGHTVGHIAFYVADAGAAFTGDSLMAMGCGRLFEGSADQMWSSLSKLAALPPDTLICSGHEYTAANAKFALSVDRGNADLAARITDIDAARAAGRATVPSALSLELATNPFLRAAQAEMKAGIGMPDASDAAVFAEIRKRKDNF